MKEKIQTMGKALSGMVMPNIGAFIAWGFITALFISSGWIPNAGLASIQPFMLSYLIPVLIAAQGGKMVGGDRGRVMGAIAIMGCIAGDTEHAMLMAAMVVGPFAGWIIKKFDQIMDGHMPAGFEMLINNFSVGIFGMIMAIIGYYAIGPTMGGILAVLSAGVEVLVNRGLLPLVSILLEPAKVLFLNNAINHGVFTPLGAEQVVQAGKSIMYMLETNPGPGLGVLLAYWMFSKDKITKGSAFSATIIHLFGGIHEIYFPYILMNPIIIIAPIIGNFCSIFLFSVLHAGLSGPAAPGSIIAFLMMTPRDSIIISAAGVLLATTVSFLIASQIIKMSNGKSSKNIKDEITSTGTELKDVCSSPNVSSNAIGKSPLSVKKVVFSCDAGMGSSAMGATRFRNRIKEVRPDIAVVNTSVDEIPPDTDFVVCQAAFAERAAKSAPQACLITIDNFLTDPNIDALCAALTSSDEDEKAVISAVTSSASAQRERGEQGKQGEHEEQGEQRERGEQGKQGEQKEQGEQGKQGKVVMVAEGIKLGQASVTKEEAIKAAGELLITIGCVDSSYIAAMLEREKVATTYLGFGVAIPHGTTQAKDVVKKSGIVMLQYPDGVDFEEGTAQLVFGIAGVGNEHLSLLARLSEMLEDEALLQELKTTTDSDLVLRRFN